MWQYLYFNRVKAFGSEKSKLKNKSLFEKSLGYSELILVQQERKRVFFQKMRGKLVAQLHFPLNPMALVTKRINQVHDLYYLVIFPHSNWSWTTIEWLFLSCRSDVELCVQTNLLVMLLFIWKLLMFEGGVKDKKMFSALSLLCQIPVFYSLFNNYCNEFVRTH